MFIASDQHSAVTTWTRKLLTICRAKMTSLFKVVMGKLKMPAATRTSKGTGSEYSNSTTTSPEMTYTDILDSIEQKLTSLEARLALVEVPQKKIQALKELLEYCQNR
ncbi:hypothetical protein ATANTOWER_025583 [Ataeniobius toweri]|uniref:Uncharacterized protein n=1 Tax=Ataeniobius toweri TaxID=208326 RepID=A0ABU7AT24_9TELE|nr:hypothetical protein [Ataeniobius toweri]